LAEEKVLHYQIENDWLSIARRLLTTVSDWYSDSVERVKDTEKGKTSWRDWVVRGVLPALSERGKSEEAIFWETNAELTLPVNWRIILYLLRRYQSSLTLSMSIAKIGRKPTKSLEVQAYLKDCLENSKPVPNDAQLSKLLDISTKTIAKVKRELGL